MARKRILTVAPTDEEIMAYRSVPVEVAANYLGTSTVTLRRALQLGTANNLGIAVPSDSLEEKESYRYIISPGALVKFRHSGEQIIRLGSLEPLLAEALDRIMDAKLKSLGYVPAGEAQ